MSTEPTPPSRVLDTLVALDAKSHPAPWSREWNEVDPPHSGIDIEAGGVRVALIEDPDDEHEVANADLIVAMRNALPAMLRALRAAESYFAERKKPACTHAQWETASTKERTHLLLGHDELMDQLAEDADTALAELSRGGGR